MRLRARLLRRIRAFFDARGVLEVETPLLAPTTATDPHLESFEVRPPAGAGGPRPPPLYLQTSPEFAMKRLLAAGSGPIYQLGRAFRGGEASRLHNREFTILEWYRPGFDQHALMDEVEALLALLLGPAPGRRATVRSELLAHAGVDVATAGVATLRAACRRHGLAAASAASLDGPGCLDYLLGGVVQPALGPGRVYLHDFPVPLAALARVRPGPPAVAERFEVFVDRVEVANGYHELTDARELQRRQRRDLARRRRAGLPALPLDARLRDALAHGLPHSSGVAVGVDRLVMAAARAQGLDAVLAFPADIA